DSLCSECAEHFERVRAYLDAFGVPYTIDSTLVRGLDYYTRTAFEFIGPDESTQASTICGGGRYDYLIEEIGGAPTPGIGFGAGIERLLIQLEDEGITAEPEGIDVLFVLEDGAPRERVLETMGELRRAGLACDTDYAGRSVKGQMTQAGRAGARTVVVVRAGDAAVRRRGEPEQVVALDDLLATLSA